MVPTAVPSRLSPVDPADDAALASVYGELKKSYPFVPNWYASMSSRPDLIEANLRLTAQIVGRGKLPTALKELVIAAISMQRGCEYCTAAHRMAARASGVAEEVIADVLTAFDTSRLPPTQRTMVSFALACAEDPKALTHADFEALRDIGLDDGEIAELVMVVGYTFVSNIWSDASGVAIDAAFEA